MVNVICWYVILACFLCFNLIGCSNFQNHPTPVLLTFEETTHGKIEIFQLGTKVDSDGNVQCVNYARKVRNDSIIEIYGYHVLATVAAILEIPVNRISSSRDSLYSTFIHIRYLPAISDTISAKGELLTAVSETFRFTIDSFDHVVEAYEVVLTDEFIFNTKKSSHTDLRPIRSTLLDISSEGVTVGEMIEEVNRSMDNEVYTKIPDSALYEMTVSIKDALHLQQSLNRLGLDLKKNELLLTYFVITDLPS